MTYARSPAMCIKNLQVPFALISEGISAMPKCRLIGIFLVVAALMSTGSELAVAQNAREPIDIFGGMAPSAIIQAAQSEWRKLPEREITCVDQALRRENSSLRAILQQGVTPSDAEVSGVRSSCRNQVAQQAPQLGRTDTRVSPYVVDGLALGGRVRFDSAAYRDYQCDPSDQFDGFTWCHKTSRERERRGSFDVSYTILHSRDESAFYINRNQAPAFWDANEVNEDIDRYSRKIGERPRIISMPRRQGLPNGIIAHWGNVVLEPLDSDSLKVLAEGKSPKKGILFDFVGNLARSAREGLPVYRVSGGAGFVWVASYDQNGRGSLQFSAVDASAFMPQVARTPVPTPSIPASLYVVDGFALGGRVPLDGAAYNDYQCDPSDQFDGFTWCTRKSTRGNVISSNSILHSQDGTAVYVNHAVVPAYFDRNEFDRDIQNLSNRFGEKARTLKLSQRRGLPDAVIASWGKVNLEPLDPNSISILASGGNVKKGFLIDFLGDWEQSARQGLPIYRLLGGAGYVWAASRNNEGRGHVRFLTIDASALMPQVARTPVPTPSIPGSDGKVPAPQQPPEPAISSGTGFFVSTEGHIITNAHVVADCRSVSSSRGGQIQLVSPSTKNPISHFISLRRSHVSRRVFEEGGERVSAKSVVAIGFPLSGLLSSDPIVTTGTISALAGLKNDRREIQITAPVQPGNSGGPLIGETGSVVGVIVGKLDAVKVARAIGDIPQNVNFAVSLGTLQSFLNANAVPYIIDEGTVAQTPADIAAEASRYTVLLECLQ